MPVRSKGRSRRGPTGSVSDDTRAVRRLQGALDARATPKARRFWSRYLRGQARFRGVAMADIRRVVHGWWVSEGFGERSLAAQKRTALGLFEQEATEDRLAGVLALSEILLPRLSVRDLPSFARLFARGRIADWNLCDWFCVKVLGRMLERAEDPAALVRAISAWRASRPLWQRRAACVAFVNHARHGDARIPGLTGALLASCEALVRDPERFAQTGVGWVLRELSLHDRAAVLAFAERNLDRLSGEALRSLTQKMPAADSKRLLASHAGTRREPARAARDARRARGAE